MIAVSGLSILWATRPVGVCLLSWIIAWNLILELGDWELRQRLPACRDYMRRTPRYLPRLGKLTLRRTPPPP
jgi:steroid 5-alpha reductase family enzyme